MNIGYIIGLDGKEIFTGTEYEGRYYDYGCGSFTCLLRFAKIFNTKEAAEAELSRIRKVTYSFDTGWTIDGGRLAVYSIEAIKQKEEKGETK